MSNISETGHAKNVANLDLLHSIVDGMGDAYRPVRNNLSVISIQGLVTTSLQAIENVKDTQNFNNDQINGRRDLFDTVPPLLPRILSVFFNNEASDRTTEDVSGLIAKFRGARRNKLDDEPVTPTNVAEGETRATAAEKAAKKISVSQKSFDKQIDTFSGIVSLIGGQTNYLTNEPDLQPATLTALKLELQRKNKAAKDANTKLAESRLARNKTLYTPKTGLIYIAHAIVDHLRTMQGGTQNSHYKKAVKIRFTKPKDLKLS